MPKRRRHRGEGSAYHSKSKRRWIARFPLGGGRYKYASAQSELGARQELERLRRAYGADADPATGTLDDFLASWLEQRRRLRPGTRVSYAGHINNHISPLLGGIPVARLSRRDVRRLIADRERAGLSPATIARIHATLSAALAWGVRERLLLENAAAHVELPRPEERLVEAMTEDRADDIREAVRDTYLEALVELLLGSGLRLGEALGLNQGDLAGNVVMVRRSKGRQRAVVVSDDAAEALRQHIAGNKVRGKDVPVFFGPRSGRRLTTWTVSHALRKVAGVNPHALRHASATLMVAKGAHMKVVAEQLGHRSVQTTDRFYAHVAPSSLQDAVRLLNRRKA